MDDASPVPGGRRERRAARARRGLRLRYWLLAVPMNLVIGYVAVVPYVLGVATLQQYVLAPRGLAALDPTFDDGAVDWVLAALVVAGAVAGFVCANLLLAGWAGHTWTRWLVAVLLNGALAVVVLISPGVWDAIRWYTP
ncbi:hypothetical protein ACIB24_04305 [Spongisporangium articulatum]|uniref:Uncharacterized protein n=1 Tax=Spongisporangium articulatum TaxID=3362603 RepID=A0ABW8AIU2_9ACTN